MRVWQKGLISWARWVEYPNQSQPNLITDLMCHPVEDDCIVSERKVMVRQTKLMLHINTIKNQNRRVVCPLATSPAAAPSPGGAPTSATPPGRPNTPWPGRGSPSTELGAVVKMSHFAEGKHNLAGSGIAKINVNQTHLPT